MRQAYVIAGLATVAVFVVLWAKGKRQSPYKSEAQESKAPSAPATPPQPPETPTQTPTDSLQARRRDLETTGFNDLGVIPAVLQDIKAKMESADEATKRKLFENMAQIYQTSVDTIRTVDQNTDPDSIGLGCQKFKEVWSLGPSTIPVRTRILEYGVPEGQRDTGMEVVWDMDSDSDLDFRPSGLISNNRIKAGQAYRVRFQCDNPSTRDFLKPYGAIQSW